MKAKIVVADGCDKAVFKRMQEDDNLDIHGGPKVDQETLQTLLPEAQGLVVRSATNVTAELLDKAPQLKYVIRAGEGTDNIDKEECQKRGIKVSNTPGANNNSAAEHAVGLMLSALRNVGFAHATMKHGGWDKSRFTGTELSGKNVGILGLGQIGQRVAKLLSGFEPNIFYYNRTELENVPTAYHSCSTPEELFEKSDVLTIHLPKNNSTKGLVNRKLLESMQAHAVLVNTSRGGIVDEEALQDVLANKKIRAAAFDVYAEEPLPENSPLRELDNFLMTPHLGAATEEAQERVGEKVHHQLTEFFVNNNLLNEVRA